jgi:single-strand DNA-binding protein
MLNQIIVVGRLGKAPEMSYSAAGDPITKFSVATDHGFGEKRETTWHNIVCFGKTAEACAQYLDKGSIAGVVGRQSHRKYEKDGQTRYFSEIVADRVQFIGDTKRADEPVADDGFTPDEVLPF